MTDMNEEKDKMDAAAETESQPDQVREEPKAGEPAERLMKSS